CIVQTHLELIRTLRGLTRKFGSFDEEDGDARFARNPNSAFAEWLYCVRKVQAHFHAGEYVLAIEAATRAQRHTASGYLYQVAALHFYSALSHAAVWRGADEGDHSRRCPLITDNSRTGRSNARRTSKAAQRWSG